MFANKIFFLCLILTALLNCNSSPDPDNQKKPEKPKAELDKLSNEQLVKIGRDGHGPGTGFSYDLSVPAPVKEAGQLADGLYRLRDTRVEASEGSMGGSKAYAEILERQMHEKKEYGFLIVSAQGQQVVEYRFDKKSINKNIFQSDGTGVLTSSSDNSCPRFYYIDEVDADKYAKGKIRIAEYCVQQGQEFEKAGILKHVELWNYWYEPYELKN